MLGEYFRKLYGVYQEKGFVPAISSFGKSFVEYLFLEANFAKLNQIKGDKFFCEFPYVSRDYAESITGQPFRKLSNQDLEKIISDAKTEFLAKIV